MATTDQTTGDLNRCGYCGAALTLQGGTDPDEAEDGFTETYECANGHTGTYKYEYMSGREDFTGACR